MNNYFWKGLKLSLSAIFKIDVDVYFTRKKRSFI